MHEEHLWQATTKVPASPLFMAIPTDTSIRALAAYAIIVRPDGRAEQEPFSDFKQYLFERAHARLRENNQDTMQPGVIHGEMAGMLERLASAAEMYCRENDGQKQEIRYPFGS